MRREPIERLMCDLALALDLNALAAKWEVIRHNSIRTSAASSRCRRTV